MTPNERQDAKRVAQVIRAGRKLAGLSQSDLAKTLNITQPTLSNLESAKGLPSVSLWYDLCNHLHIPGATRAFRSGLIDRGTPAVASRGLEFGAFRIPKKYLRYAGSKVRVTRPFIRYFSSVYGEGKLQKYFEYVGVDPDLFTVLDNQISVKFTLDLAEALIQDGKLRPSDISKLTGLAGSAEVHGRLTQGYRAVKTQRELIKGFLSRGQMYDVNMEYQLEEENTDFLALSVRPRAIMRHFKHKSSTLGTFFSDCRKEWVRQFATLGGRMPPRVETLENYYQGAPKCVYKVFV